MHYDQNPRTAGRCFYPSRSLPRELVRSEENYYIVYRCQFDNMTSCTKKKANSDFVGIFVEHVCNHSLNIV